MDLIKNNHVGSSYDVKITKSAMVSTNDYFTNLLLLSKVSSYILWRYTVTLQPFEILVDKNFARHKKDNVKAFVCYAAQAPHLGCSSGTFKCNLCLAGTASVNN